MRFRRLSAPAGNRLSTTARVEQRPGQAGPRVLGDITRTVTGAQPWTLNAPSDDVRKLMPNLAHMANDMPEVQASIQRMVEDNPDMIKRWTQGTITHEELKDLAEHLGMTAEDFLKTPVGKAWKPEEQLALRSAVVSKKEELGELSKQVQAKGGAKELNSKEKADFLATALSANQLLARARGGASTLGRGLNQQKINVDRGLAAAVTGGNESKRAQAALDAAAEKGDRSNTLIEQVRQLRFEREEARRAARAGTESTPSAPAARIYPDSAAHR